MNKELIQLEKQVNDLLLWKKSKEQERLVFPIDLSSRKTLDFWHAGGVTGLLIPTGRVKNLDYINLITNYTSFDVEISVNGVLKTILVSMELFPFTVNIGTDFITSTNGQHNLNNGDTISLTTNGAGMPTPLDIDIVYYIVNRTGNTFQVATTSGGSPIDITSDPGYTYYYAKTS